jgi:hypothetical protein
MGSIAAASAWLAALHLELLVEAVHVCWLGCRHKEEGARTAQRLFKDGFEDTVGRSVKGWIKGRAKSGGQYWDLLYIFACVSRMADEANAHTPKHGGGKWQYAVTVENTHCRLQNAVAVHAFTPQVPLTPLVDCVAPGLSQLQR